ncbi:hypothetical protein BKG70_00760 [Mycobacteroides chelonae]|uniref:hypothetical protein n=1 Tax=Mycobacteroides chelonae TaxID=1774 RepID=UPI0008A979C4|nr:hypothetical protein [Mycobacteroides chelonae]OHT91297.1 hypothetical protein BKG70_00760 [Mycobacteroides chelonae]
MSNKKKDSIKVLSKTQGMLQLAEPGPPVAVGTKVTGYNLGAVTHLVSIEAERSREKRALGIYFNEDGSLARVTVHAAQGQIADLDPGMYVTLEALDRETVAWFGEDLPYVEVSE